MNPYCPNCIDQHDLRQYGKCENCLDHYHNQEYYDKDEYHAEQQIS